MKLKILITITIAFLVSLSLSLIADYDLDKQFEDALLKIIWIPKKYEFHFTLTNKISQSIKVMWDDAAFVDSNKTSHRVIHSGIDYDDRNKPQAATVVARGFVKEARSKTLSVLIFLFSKTSAIP